MTLKTHSVDAARVLSEKLAVNKLCLEAIPDTPLAALVKSCYDPRLESDVDEGVDNATTQDFEGLLMESCSRKTESGAITHTEELDAMVKQVSQTVSENLQLAKNVVNPMIVSVVDEVEQQLRETEISAVNYLSVLPYHYRKIFSSDILVSQVEKHSDMPSAKVKFKKQYPEMAADDIVANMKTGVARFDTEIEGFVSEVGHELIQKTYDSVFKKEVGEVYVNYDLEMYAPLRYRRYDEILIIYLLSRRLQSNVPDGVAVSLEEHRSYMLELMAQTGRLLCRILEARENAVKRGNLDIHFGSREDNEWVNDNPTDDIITVNGDVYNKWLAAGGCPEILFGARLTDRERDFNKLIEKKEYYVKAWERQSRIRGAEVANERYGVTIVALRRAVKKEINNLEDDELNVTDRGALFGALEEQLSMVKPKGLDDLHYTARKMICRTIFAHTNAEAILSKIDEYGQRYPDIEVREAALYAAIDYVTDWIQCMIKHDDYDNKEPCYQNNVLVTVNAIELASCVIECLAGNEISNHLNGEVVRPSDLTDAVAARIQTHYSRYMDVA